MSAGRRNLNDGPVARQLARVSAPMSVGIFSVLAIGLADAFFLARVGDSELAAVGFVYPVIVVVSAFSVGLSAGANTALSQARGREISDEDVGHMAFHAALLGLGLGLAIALAFWLLSPFIFSLLGASGEVRANILSYVPFWISSFPLLVVTMIVNAAFRAAGDGVTAAAMMVLTAALNIALNPVLIFGLGPMPELGMAGAGLGTLIARAVGFALVLLLAVRRGILAIGPTPLKGTLRSGREIVGVAMPAAGSRAINPLGMSAVTAAVATVSDAAVAGFGAATRIEAVALVPFFAVAAGLGPVVGQAWGAKKAERARAAMRSAAWFSFIYGLALGTVLTVFADDLAAFMTASGQAADFTADYLRFVGWSVGGYGLAIAANAALTGRSRASWAMGLSLLRVGALYVPLAWVGVIALGYDGILAAAAVANVITLWAALVATYAQRIGPSALAPVAVPGRRIAMTLPGGDDH